MTIDTPSVLALCVSAEVRALNAVRRTTGQRLAAEIGRSQNYVAERLRDLKPFTLDDVDAICRYYDLEPAAFVAKAYDDNLDQVYSELERAGVANVVSITAKKESEDAANVAPVRHERTAANRRKSRVEDEPESTP